MDAAWALYEAWVAIQTGEVDSALDLRLRQVVAQRPARGHDAADRPVLRRAAVAVDGRPGRAAGRRRTSTTSRSRPSATSPRSRPAAAAQRASATRTRCAPGTSTPTTLLGRRSRTDPLRDADIAPITDGAAAIVIAAGDVARDALRAAGVDPRASSTASRRTHSACATSPTASRPDAPARRPARCRAASTSPSSTRSSATRS